MGEFLIRRIILAILLLLIVISGSYSEDLNIDKNMVFVKGGEFLLGKKGVTSHLVRVRLNDFYISKYETTVEQWEQFLEETGTSYQWKDEYTNLRDESPYPKSPIGVHWQQAIKFANWASRISGLSECYTIKGDDIEWHRNATGYRLPTDAEWEFAARGGTLSKGYIYSGCDDIDEVAWTGWNSDGYAHPVGLKKANELGLYDMSGNLREWCWDLSLKYPAYTINILKNPSGPNVYEYQEVKDKRYRISRGGSYGTADEFPLTPYHRTGAYEFGEGANGQGFRLARNAP